jgi:hypothetical protein
VVTRVDSGLLKRSCADVCHLLDTCQAEVHTTVVEASKQYMRQHNRFVYTTPLSFLGLIDLFKHQLKEHRQRETRLMTRLANGLDTLKRTTDEVEKLADELQSTMVCVRECRNRRRHHSRSHVSVISRSPAC